MMIKLGQVSLSIQAIVTEIYYISNHLEFYLKPLNITVQILRGSLVVTITCRTIGTNP